MSNIFAINGTTKIPKGKAATFGFKLFETDSKKEFIDFINRHSICPATFERGHRRNDNITAIQQWFRLDVDTPKIHKKIDKKLNKANIFYIKKPSTNNADFDYKWHYLIPTQNVSMNTDAYRLQYYAFLAAVGIDTEWVDMSLDKVVQHMNPYKHGRDVEVARKLTKAVKGDTYIAKDVKVVKRVASEKKSSDTKKSDVKKKLMTITEHVERDRSGNRKPESKGMGYEEFLKIGMALYDWCPKRGYKLYKKWAEKTGSYYAGDVDDKWNDFEGGSLSGDVGLGSLFTMDKYGQYVEPREEDVFLPATNITYTHLTYEQILRGEING